MSGACGKISLCCQISWTKPGLVYQPHLTVECTVDQEFTANNNVKDPVGKDEIIDAQSARRWRNQNAFAARCVEEGVGEWAHFGIWQLRAALEEERAADQAENRECLILAASEWAIHSGARLLQWAADEDKEPEPFDWGTDVAAGSLFQGNPGLSHRRWNFWKDRFNEASKDTGLWNEGAIAAAREAFESMTEAETRKGNKSA